MVRDRSPVAEKLFAGPGESRALCRAIDWGSTRLGPVEDWPSSLQTAVRLCLASSAAMAVWAGVDLILIHNDGYLPVLGAKALWAMGKPGREVWTEVWATLGLEFQAVVEQRAATRHEEAQFRLLRQGREEETYFSYSLTPIEEQDGRVVGVLNVLQEVTAAVHERHRREGLFAAIVESSPDLIAAVDTDYRYLAMNRAYVEECRHIFGIELRPGSSLMDALATVPDDQRSAVALFGRALQGETVVAAGEFGDPARERRSYELTFAPIRNSEGRTVGAAQIGRNTTDRKRMEEALRCSEELLSFALTTARVGAWELDLEDRTARRSLQHDQIFGYRELLPRWTYEIFLEHVIPDDRELVDRAFREAVAAGADWSFECRIRREDGELRWIWGAGRHSAQENGRRRMTGIVQDVTDRRQAEEALEESRTRYQQLIETNVDFVWEIDTKGRYTYCSPQMEQLWGFHPQDMIGKTPFDTMPAEQRAPALQHFRDHLLHPAPFMGLEIRSLNSRGELVDNDVSGVPFFDEQGALAGYRGTTRDITARKAAEAALRGREARFRVLIENVNAGVALLDESGSFTLYNRQFLALFGLSEDLDLHSVNAQDWCAWQIFDEAGQLLHLDQHPMRRASLLRQPVRNQLVRVRPPGDRQQLWLVVSAAPLFAVDGRLEHIICTYQNVTELKRAEEGLRRSQEALRQANERLLEADRRKNEFLGVLSHELRNPLAPIKNSLHLLERVAPGGDQARRAQAIIGRQAEQLSRLVDDLLDVTRISRKKVQLQRQRLELNDLVRRTLEDHQPTFERAGVRIQLAPTADPIFISADENRIAQVLGNLLENAAKFTPAGGQVTVFVSTDEAQRAVLQVADTGAGLPPEVAARLFEPFVQADRTLDRSKGGLGLGLSLVKGMVELHGGEVGARSAGPGQGSVFTIHLPLDLTEPAPVAPEPVTAGAAGRRVLVIEDNVDAAESLRDLLELAGHEVQVAHSGPEGVARARAIHPEVVICDIGLPGMDGYAVARALRADQTLGQVRLIALTGYALPEDRQRAAAAGFDHHLAKPASLETLGRVLQGHSGK